MKNVFSLAGLLVLMSCSALVDAAEQLYTVQPSMMPELAEPGDWSVGVVTLDVSNPDQLDSGDFSSRKDRGLTLEVWYPARPESNAVQATYDNVTRLRKPFSVQGEAIRDANPVDGGRFPLVVLSHGYTGYRTLMFYLGEHLASHGYVVASIDHTDSTNAEIDFLNNRGSGFVSTLLNRARDQQFVLEELSASTTAVGRLIDADKASVIGYSMGGYGAVNTVGGCYQYTRQRLEAFGMPPEAAANLLPVFNGCNAWREAVDARWKAMIAIAPWGQQQALHNVKNVHVPSLYVSGANDDISGHENGVARLFAETGAEHKFLLVYENARHNIVPHPAPTVAYETDIDLGHYIEPSWQTEQLNRINEHIMLAFLDCYVKLSADACTYLPVRDDIAQMKQADGSLSEPWPGFPDRWGLGVRFYRGGANAGE